MRARAGEIDIRGGEIVLKGGKKRGVYRVGYRGK